MSLGKEFEQQVTDVQTDLSSHKVHAVIIIHNSVCNTSWNSLLCKNYENICVYCIIKTRRVYIIYQENIL